VTSLPLQASAGFFASAFVVALASSPLRLGLLERLKACGDSKGSIPEIIITTLAEQLLLILLFYLCVWRELRQKHGGVDQKPSMYNYPSENAQ